MRQAPFHVTYTLVNSNAYEVAISLGQGHITVKPPNPDAPQSFETKGEIEWAAALTLSPQTALHLWRQLADVLERYTRIYGAIPTEPQMPANAPDAKVVSLWGSRTAPPADDAPQEPPPLSA